MQANALRFYQFSGAHALLIGLLPFYLPALLWQAEFDLADISLFIALSGFGYSATLVLWDHLRARSGHAALINTSFALVVALVAAIVFDPTLHAFHFTAVLYGVYGCFYWMTQRLLFIDCAQIHNTGRQFGNAQILVTVMLKIGIVSGGFLWDRVGGGSVFIAAILASAVSLFVCRTRSSLSVHDIPHASTLKRVATFKDTQRSRSIFAIDGVFLFAESFFWVITLYKVANQNIAQLGLLVVALSVLLAGVFFVIKNRLDAVSPQRIYLAAVLGYAASWLLRAAVDAGDAALWTYITIVLIAFLTALFRLVFNKRFFDNARQQDPHFYIAAKSYWSQFVMGVAFIALSVTLFAVTDAHLSLPLFYVALVPVSMLYLHYRWQAQAPSNA